ncbi:non-reducing end alpha-L-arabinofuranosidase family hydrolase [Streptomyces iakyrus]
MFASTAGSSLLVEAIGSDGLRCSRSWTSGSLAGSWTQPAASESNPFARANNVSFPSPACRLQYLYQDLNPDAGGAYDLLPWQLGLLTQTNRAADRMCRGERAPAGSAPHPPWLTADLRTHPPVRKPRYLPCAVSSPPWWQHLAHCRWRSPPPRPPTRRTRRP